MSFFSFSNASRSLRGWRRGLLGIGLLAGLVFTSGGCEVSSFLDPSEVRPGKNFSSIPLFRPILGKLDTRYEEPNDLFPNAVDVTPADLTVDSSDYVIGKTDVLAISITDLVGQNVETVKQVRVTESGNISLPYVRQISAEGLTEAELEDRINKAYHDSNIITNAQVSVVVIDARQKTFTIHGSIAGPGEYGIIRSDYRLLDALTLARDVTSPGIDYVYVIRQPSKAPRKKIDPANVDLAPDKGKTPATAPSTDLSPRSSATATRQPIYAADVAPRESGPTVITDGKAVPVRTDKPKASGEKPVDMASEPQVERTIRVPLKELKNGQMKYNIVIRPRDFIMVPPPLTGEYYISGHIARPGVYSLTARNITLKQAIAAAGMFDGVAIPERGEIIRRVGHDQEIFVRVDFHKIWEGENSDIFLKPDDIVHCGTNIFAPFLAAVRGGFRASYGFGFIYDRNLAYSSQNR